ncbi:ICMT-domain-containing protein, partial [Rhizopogon vinicolor AM-OR11-026]
MASIPSDTSICCLLLNSMVAAKVCLHICATGAQLFSMTPPNARPDPKERLKPTDPELTVSWLHDLVKGILCSWSLAEISVAFATAHESAISKPITSLLVRTHSLPDFDFTASTPALIAGCCMCVIGAAVRSHCYRTLGRLFTFELSIRQDHKLVTSGPYSIVRHPSYTGVW